MLESAGARAANGSAGTMATNANEGKMLKAAGAREAANEGQMHP